MSDDLISILLAQRSYLEQWNDTKIVTESISDDKITPSWTLLGDDHMITSDGKLIRLKF